MCKSTQGSLCPSLMKIQNWPFFKNLSQKVNNPKWPLDDLWPHICWCLMCDSTQGSLCPTPMVIHQIMWIQWLFFKNLTKKSMTPRRPLTPCVLRSHVWFYPRIIVFKSHWNTSMYVDTVINSAKYHIHTTYEWTYYVQNEWSHSLFLNKVQARQ